MAVILATGTNGRFTVPLGLRSVPCGSGRIVFWTQLDKVKAGSNQILIVGNGLTAVQVALKLLKLGKTCVLCSRRHTQTISNTHQQEIKRGARQKVTSCQNLKYIHRQSSTSTSDASLPGEEKYLEGIPGWELIHCPPRKFPRGALDGTVVSDKMQKTINIAIEYYRIIPKYKKRRKYTRKFMAHDEEEVCNLGYLIIIVPCRKLSKMKHFHVQEIIKAKGQL